MCGRYYIEIDDAELRSIIAEVERKTTIKTGEIYSIIDKSLERMNLTRITNEEMIQLLGSKFLIVCKDYEGVFSYIRRPTNDEYTNFGEQDRRNPILALLHQGQVNLTLVKQ